MGRLIDADEIKKREKDVVLANGALHRCFDTTMLSEIPTAVEVVRCKDCKYLNIINKAPVYACCSKHNHTFYLWEEDTRKHFCSWGERRKDE